MKKTCYALALLAGSALSQTAYAQTPATTDDAPIAAEAPPTPEENAAQTAFLQAQVEALQTQLEALKKQVNQVQPSWKGAPQFSGENGFTFKPKGFAQFDAGYVGIPGQTLNGTVGGLNYNNLGWNSRARRLVIGAEGTLPGGFAYKAEFNLAQGTVDYEDITIAYQRAGSPLLVTVGNFYPLSSLETMTSSRLGSFLERAQLTEAFGYDRRLGLSVALVDPADRYTLTAGVFNRPINDASPSATVSPHTGWQASVRGTFSPTLGETRLHLGANFQYRKNQRDAQNVNYQVRPFTQLTDQRFVSTGTIAADGDSVAGIELGAIHGPVHFAGEAQKLWVRGYQPGRTFGPNNGVAGAAFYNDDPSFVSGYAELGFYLTGESRGYKGGKWDRTKVLNPFDKGGWGALQINGRVDYVNLKDRVGSGATFAAPNYINGGRQIGYSVSLIWNPMDYIRFLAQYTHADVQGGPRTTAVTSVDASETVNQRSFGSDIMALRAQVEF